MLLLSGVLLVLGFVILGTALVQLQGMEGTTERTQRDNVMRTAEELVAGLNQTIQDSLVIGETNTTSFKETLRGAEASFRDNAVRAGLYASVQLVEDIDNNTEAQKIFSTPGRCIGWNRDASAGGIIVGWEAETFEESIAGAVYHIHLTDGKQSFRTDLYVKLLNCADVEITSTHTTMGMTHGSVSNPGGMRQQEGMTNFTEELDEDNIIELDLSPTIIPETIEATQWQAQGNIAELDSNFAHVRGSSGVIANNKIEFKLEAPVQMHPDDIMENVNVTVTGYKTPDQPLDPNLIELRLRVYATDDSSIPFRSLIVPLTTENMTHSVAMDGPSGEGWTRSEIENAKWELLGVGVPTGGHHRIYVDHFDMEGTATMSLGYRLEAYLDWQNIPHQYGEHELHVRYKVDPATDDEGFLLQVRDTQDDTSTWTTLHNMTDTMDNPDYCVSWDDGWCTFVYEPDPGDPDTWLPNRPEFRIIDTIIVDNWVPEDQDTLQIELLQIHSRLQDA